MRGLAESIRRVFNPDIACGFSKLGRAARRWSLAAASAVLLPAAVLAQGPGSYSFTATDLDGGQLLPGDTVRLTLQVLNFPSPTDFESGSLSVDINDVIPGFSTISGTQFISLDCGSATIAESGEIVFSNISMTTANFACTMRVDALIPLSTTPATYNFATSTFDGTDTSGAPTAFSQSATNFALTVENDTVAPVPSISGPAGPVDAAFNTTISFSEPVFGFDVADLTVTNATVSEIVSGDEGGGEPRETALLEVTPTGGTPITIQLPAASVTDEAGNDNTASNLYSVEVGADVADSVTFDVAVSGDPIAGDPADSFAIDFTIANSSATETLTSGFFIYSANDLPSGSSFSGTAPATPCGASSSISGVPGGNLFLSNAELAPGASCTFQIDVTLASALAAGVYPIAPGDLSFTLGGTGGTKPVSGDLLEVAGAEATGGTVEFSKTFLDDPVAPGDTVDLEFSISAAGDFSVTGMSFTDDLDATLSGLVAVGLPASDVCGAGSTLSGTSVLTLTGANLATGATCTFTTTLQVPGGAADGDYVNTTSSLTATRSDTGAVTVNPASDTLSVTAPVDPAPTVVVSGPAGPVGAGYDFTAEFRFSEPVTGFEVGEINVVNGTAANFQAISDTEYTATITAGIAGSVDVNVIAGAAQDSAMQDNKVSNTFSITAVTPVADVKVSILEELTDGQSVASAADGTYFGVVDVSAGSVTRTVQIENVGTGDLTLFSIGQSPAVFQTNTAGISPILSPGETTSFRIIFDPSSTGTITSTYTLGSDDPDEGSFSWVMEGEGGAAPEIDVADASGTISIPDGDSTPQVADNTDFGATAVGGAGVTHSFLIRNEGGATLTLGANAVSVTGDADAFTVTTQPATTVAPGGSTTFSIQFVPTAVGGQQALVSIANDDASESPYTFGIQGAGLDQTPPAGFAVAFDAGVYGPINASSASFTIYDGEVFADYAYTITSTGGGTPVTGSGTIPARTAGALPEDQITGIDLSGLGSGALTVSVTLTDTEGNTSAAETGTATLDLVRPTTTLSSAATDPVSGAFTLNINFNEPVAGFTLGDVDIANGAASGFVTNSGSSYSVTVTPAGDGPVFANVYADAAQDAAGNGNTAAAEFSRTNDETPPTVSFVGTGGVSSGQVNGPYEVFVDFSEDVTGFDSTDPSVTNGSVTDFEALSGNRYRVEITPAASGTVSLVIPAGVAQDAAGNGNTVSSAYEVDADVDVPTADSLVVSDNDIRLNDVGDTFTVTVTFSEPVQTNDDPILTFSDDVAGTLSFQSGAFSSGDTVYTASYSILDNGETYTDTDITVSGVYDLLDNALVDTTFADQFSIEMRRGSITVTESITGTIDGDFDFTGDLGAFTISTLGQTGSEFFTGLTEGSYTFAVADEDGFVLDDIVCTGGSVSVDLPNRSATVTLAPSDTVTCTFETFADAAVDETQIPDLALTLPENVTDPTGVTANLPLYNVGASPFYFTAATDQPWLAVDPTSGSIPAAGGLNLTVSFTAAALDLAPGTYTANIIITETAGPPPNKDHSSAASLSTITVPVTITIENREGDLTLIATTGPAAAGDDSFSYTSDLGAVDGLILTTSGGSATSGVLTVDSGTYQINQAALEGWDLASISCTGDDDGGNVIDLENGTLTLDLDGGEAMVCTFANQRNEDYIRRVTQSAIRSFMAARADQILTNSPTLTSRMREDRAGATPNRFAADFRDGRFNATMSTSLSAMRQLAEENAPQQPGAERFSLGGQTGMSSLDVWMQASFSSVSDNRAGLNSDSEFGIYYLGTDFMVNEDLMVGALLQYDQAETTTGELRSEVEGDGWMFGPYMVARIGENAFFDARAAWGQSDNEVNPIGTYVDEFETDRWMIEANLVGDIIRGNWRISPEVGVAYFNEEQAAYTDTLGFFIPSQEITIGRIDVGPEIAYRFENPDGSYFEPYVRVQALYDYDDADVINAGGQLQTLGHMRADARFGLTAELANGGRITGEVAVMGLGEGEFEANNAMIRVRLPLSMH